MKKSTFIIIGLCVLPHLGFSQTIKGSQNVSSFPVFKNQDGGDTIKLRGDTLFTKSSAGAWTARATNQACVPYSETRNMAVKPNGFISFCYESISTDADSGKLDIRFYGKLNGISSNFKLANPASGQILTDTSYTTKAGTASRECVGDFFFPTSIDSLCLGIRKATGTHGSGDSTMIRIINGLLR